MPNKSSNVLQVRSDIVCLLCKYSGGEDPVINTVNEYILQNINKVHIDEISAQVSTLISNEFECVMDEAMVKKHITSHVTDQRIVTQRLLRDLLDLAQQTKDHTMYYDANSDGVKIDKKMLTCYLKCVNEICGIYRTNNCTMKQIAPKE